MNLSESLERYFLDRSCKPTTECGYRIAIKHFSTWLASVGLELADIELFDEQLLSKFLRHYENVTDSPNTVRSKRKILLSVLRHGGCQLDSKAVRLPKRRVKIPDAWTPNQVSKLVLAAGEMPGRLKGIETERGQYAQAMLSLVFETGLRRGDVPCVTIQQVRAGRWRVVQNKTGVIVDCSISKITASKILRMHHVRAGSPYAFAPWGTWHLESLTTMARRAMNLAGLKSPDGCLKKLRRSSITEAECLQPGSGMLQGGHTSPKITNESYIDRSKLPRRNPTIELNAG